MRLKKVERGQGISQKLTLTMIRMMTGEPASDVIRTMIYRPELFGKPYSACVQEAMRGPSEWSIGERELFAAFVSWKNQCLF